MEMQVFQVRPAGTAPNKGRFALGRDSFDELMKDVIGDSDHDYHINSVSAFGNGVLVRFNTDARVAEALTRRDEFDSMEIDDRKLYLNRKLHRWVEESGPHHDNALMVGKWETIRK